MQHLLNQFRERIVAACADKIPLCFRGGGSKDWYGQAPQGEIFDTRAYSGIVAYEPTELVITARCGTPLTEIEAALSAHHQMLAFEPPYFGADATIGGMFAAGLSGPRRQSVGALRDFVLGAVLMDRKGEALRFGGQVMKNVAGYDMPRLLSGSLGTLGLILEVSLKVLPKPLAEASVRLMMDEKEAIAQLNAWATKPLPISASAWHDGVLLVRLSGAHAAVESALQIIGGESGVMVDDAEGMWISLREQSNQFFMGDDQQSRPQLTPLWRLSVPSTTLPMKLRGEQLIEWGGAQRWLRSDDDPAVIRAAAAQVGGHASLFRGGDKNVGVFHPLTPAVAKIHRRLKNTFDPSGVFNPGRMYAN